MDDKTVVGRTVLILDVLADSTGPLTVADVVDRTGLPSSTVHRICTDLVRRDILRRDSRGFGLGPKMSIWGQRATMDDQLRDAGRHRMWDLHQRTGQLAWLADCRSEAVRMLDFSAVHSLRAVIANWPRMEGTSLLLTAIGRVILRDRPDQVNHLLERAVPRRTPYGPATSTQLRQALAQTNDEGIAVEHQQFCIGWGCVAAPLIAPGDTVVGAIGITSPQPSVIIDRYVGLVRAMAAETNRELSRLMT